MYEENGFSFEENLSYHHQDPAATDVAATDVELLHQQQLAINMATNSYHNNNLLLPALYDQPSNWDTVVSVPNMVGPSSPAPGFYEPVIHNLNLPPQPAPIFLELFQSLPNGYNLPSSSRNVGCTSDGEIYGSMVQFENGVMLDFTRENMVQNGNNNENVRVNPERERRVHMADQYTALRKLIPNPTKTDRASIVGDAVEYIKELQRTVNELKLLVEKKRCGRDGRRSKKHKASSSHEEKNGTIGMVKPEHDQLSDHSNPTPYNAFLRSSWLQRKTKETEVDVRIVDDEVTIKLVQRKRNNVYLLMLASKLLDQLQLDIGHIAGGCIGDSYSFLFNTKLHEGSSLYASAIANKFIEVLDINQTVVSPTHQ
ncbi:hypothetical protein UlMin_002749 [Ulmus minor]